MSMFGRVAAWFRDPPAQNDSVTTATVIDNLDPSAEGRVIVQTRAPQGDEGRQWARTATLMAGPDRGTWFVPDVGDEVVVIFEQGDRRRPIVVGSLWSGRAKPPEQIGADNERRAIVTRSGARIVIDDTSEGCVTRLETAARSAPDARRSGAEHHHHRRQLGQHDRALPSGSRSDSRINDHGDSEPGDRVRSDRHCRVRHGRDGRNTEVRHADCRQRGRQ